MNVYVFSLVGGGIVFAVLAFISLAVSLLRRADERWTRKETLEEAQAAERPPTIDDTTLVLIAAAAATMVVGRARIRSVRRLPQPGRRGAWSSVGRTVLHGSHAVSHTR